MDRIRNFCIIAHIDHGKSTLTDRLLEFTGTVEKRNITEQMTDTMDLEQERGITIKLQPASMIYSAKDGADYELNLIDTPGHVDFGYEVSRSLAAVEGAILLVDSTQGVQAQTLANLYQAIEQGLEIIPVANKVDLPNSDLEKTKAEIVNLLGCKEEEIICASGKTGIGVEEILEAVVKNVPKPKGEKKKPLRALIFDSKYDTYKGVLAFVRIVDGEISADEQLFFMATKGKASVIEVGKFTPALVKTKKLKTGDIGYIATGLKSVQECRVGDTITLGKFCDTGKNTKSDLEKKGNVQALAGYKEINPMVFASFYPIEGEDYNDFRDALEKLKLNDAALTFEGESSVALGRGFRIGFLGLLHLEIIKERLAREFNFHPVITTPSVVYRIILTDGTKREIFSATEMPEINYIKEIAEPRVKLDVVMPSEYIGAVMDLITKTTRANYLKTEYLENERVVLTFNAPLSEVIINLHDGIKSVSSGYASFSYEMADYKVADLVRLDVLIAEDKVEAFSQIVPKQNLMSEAKRLTKKLKEVIPRQNFLVKIQAVVGGKVWARESITPFRKDVTGYLYGGDVTRKRKLLEKQKKGKKKMIGKGRVDIPQKAFLEVLKR